MKKGGIGNGITCDNEFYVSLLKHSVSSYVITFWWDFNKDYFWLLDFWLGQISDRLRGLTVHPW